MLHPLNQAMHNLDNETVKLTNKFLFIRGKTLKPQKYFPATWLLCWLKWFSAPNGASMSVS